MFESIKKPFSRLPQIKRDASDSKSSTEVFCTSKNLYKLMKNPTWKG